MAFLDAMFRTGNGGPLAVPLALKKAFDLAVLLVAGENAQPSRMTQLMPATAELLGIDPDDEVDAILDRD